MWKVQLAQGLWNFRQSTWLYLPPATQAPKWCSEDSSSVSKSHCCSPTVPDMQSSHSRFTCVIASTPARHKPGTSPGHHQSRRRHQGQPCLSRSRAGSARAHPERGGLPVSPHHSPMLRKHLPHTGVLGQRASICWNIPSACNAALCLLLDLSQGGGLSTHQRIRKNKPLQAALKLRAVSPWVSGTTPRAHPPQLPLPSLQPAGSRPGPRSSAAAAPAGPPQPWGDGALTPTPRRPDQRPLGGR